MSLESNTSATRQIGHAGDVLGADNVTRSSNLTGREDTVLAFECPRKFQSLHYDGSVHDTQAVLRYVQEVTVSDSDASAALEADERTFTMNDDLMHVAGEADLTRQPYPAVVVQNVTQGAEVVPADLTVDYAQNTVTVSDTAVAAGDTVKFYPIVTSGSLKFSGVDRFSNKVGAAQTFAFPLDEFVTHDQKKGNTRIRIGGSVSWETSEVVEVNINAPVQVVWTDADYPQGEYVSTFSQRVAASTV